MTRIATSGASIPPNTRLQTDARALLSRNPSDLLLSTTIRVVFWRYTIVISHTN